VSYVGEPFSHDIFVSYSHSDVDGADRSKLKQWSLGFVRELESELKEFPFGSEVRLFVDEDDRPSQGVDPMSPLTAQLRREIGRSAILVVLMSDRYLASPWCRDEREWWFDAQRQLRIPTEGRVAVVRVWPTEQAWPSALADERGEELVGFCFFDRARAKERPQPYGWPIPGPDTGGPFRDQLLDLVGALKQRLEAVHRTAAERRRAYEEALRLQQGTGHVIYLHGRAEHVKAWERTSQTLLDSGFAVVPTEPEAAVADFARLQKIRAQRVALMSECDALLLVGVGDATDIDADLVVIGRNDRHSARAISNRLLPCAIVDSTGSVATNRRRLAAQRLSVDWIDASSDVWNPSIQDWLGRTARAEAAI
jgi:hypothetical protein